MYLTPSIYYSSIYIYGSDFLAVSVCIFKRFIWRNFQIFFSFSFFVNTKSLHCCQYQTFMNMSVQCPSETDVSMSEFNWIKPIWHNWLLIIDYWFSDIHSSSNFQQRNYCFIDFILISFSSSFSQYKMSRKYSLMY